MLHEEKSAETGELRYIVVANPTAAKEASIAGGTVPMQEEEEERPSAAETQAEEAIKASAAQQPLIYLFSRTHGHTLSFSVPSCATPCLTWHRLLQRKVTPWVCSKRPSRCPCRVRLPPPSFLLLLRKQNIVFQRLPLIMVILRHRNPQHA